MYGSGLPPWTVLLFLHEASPDFKEHAVDTLIGVN
jgi:hypothetical protein